MTIRAALIAAILTFPAIGAQAQPGRFQVVQQRLIAAGMTSQDATAATHAYIDQPLSECGELAMRVIQGQQNYADSLAICVRPESAALVRTEAPSTAPAPMVDAPKTSVTYTAPAQTSDSSSAVAGIGAFAFLGLISAGWIYMVRRRKQFEKDTNDKVLSIVARHINALAAARTLKVITDAYGVVNTKEWLKECQYFWTNVVLPRLSQPELGVMTQAICIQLIDMRAQEAEARIRATVNYNDAMDGIGYEHFCADVLKRAGWECRVTKASGDHGADIEAKKDGKTLVVQCKKYSDPIGNSAVQQINTAKTIYRADYAAVVTNSSYTKAAIQAANSTSVVLLHHNQLPEVDRYLTSFGFGLALAA